VFLLERAKSRRASKQELYVLLASLLAAGLGGAVLFLIWMRGDPSRPSLLLSAAYVVAITFLAAWLLRRSSRAPLRYGSGVIAFQNDLHVHEPRGSEWDSALDVLGKGEAVVVAACRLSFRGDLLLVEVPNAWPPGEATLQTARDELERTQSFVEWLKETSDEFTSLIGPRPIVYELIDDYGAGTVLVARLSDGELEWG
jgi:hypothetical protein